MSGKEQFIKLPRELLESAAWQALSINGRRLLDFLMAEHMRRGGRENGRLVAPRRQLCASGINNGDRVTEAIAEAERLGLVSVERGNRRRANRYALAWLPLYDGSAPDMRWREYRPVVTQILRDNPPSKVGDNPPSKAPLLRDNPPSKGPKALGDNPPSLYRSSYHGSGSQKEVVEVSGQRGGTEPLVPDAERRPVPGTTAPTPGEADTPPTDPTRICGWYVTGPSGFRICQNPPLVGGERCAEHARPPAEHSSARRPNGQAAP